MAGAQKVSLEFLRKCRVDVCNGFVDLGRALVADGHAIDARIPERELHRLLPVFAVECAFADELHGDHAHSFFAHFLHVLDDFGDIPQALRVVVLGVHALALVIHPDHGDVEPLVSRDPAQRGQAVDRRAVTHDRPSSIRLPESRPASGGVGRPGCGVLPVQQHDVEIVGVRQLAQLVEFFLRDHAFMEWSPWTSADSSRAECPSERRPASCASRHRTRRSRRSGCRDRRHSAPGA